MSLHDIVSRDKNRDFLANMHSFLLGIFIKYSKKMNLMHLRNEFAWIFVSFYKKGGRY
ncbi:hypothetical protein HMPREF9446_00732 [Bacteroides fluxus YIT 12057]|uniref:Uncharacterized protein n=1 Tax=Bacteroides fluxus YIT 12057 TaxID=763034 RepID=F3PPU0_9BACE|nr:hypothetical protein HMPREF9446_00732 [Bacteroides fluxus YIT 12057]